MEGVATPTWLSLPIMGDAFGKVDFVPPHLAQTGRVSNGGCWMCEEPAHSGNAFRLLDAGRHIAAIE